MAEAMPELIATVARLLAGAALFCAPGAALCYWLYPRRSLDSLERAFFSLLASLCLLTLVGVCLLEVEGCLDSRALAYWSVACTVTFAVLRGGMAILAQGRDGDRSHGRTQRLHGPGRPGEGVPSARSARTHSLGRSETRRDAIRVRGTRQPIPARFRPRCYRADRAKLGPFSSLRTRMSGHGTRASRPPRSSGTSEVLGKWRRYALPRAALLGTAVLTLLAYRACALRPAAGGGPLASFSVPAAELEVVQAALQAATRTGGSAAIPFRIEHLGRDLGLYRVEAWTAGRAGATPPIPVAAGATYGGEVEVRLPAGAAAPLDLYLYPGEAMVPLAHLRLWPAGE